MTTLEDRSTMPTECAHGVTTSEHCPQCDLRGLRGDRCWADTRALHWAVLHLYHQDHANAALHTAPVRYSPLTFRLVEALSEQDRQQDMAEMGHSFMEVARVLEHRGTYAEDEGR